MKVKIRHIDKTVSTFFTECKFTEFYLMINFINEVGGIYYTETAEYEPIVTWYLCVDNNECYAEIIVGEHE